MEVKNNIKCSACERFFSTVYNLRKHVKKFHADKLDILVPTKSYNFRCENCNRNFTHLRHLKYHKKHKHEEPSNDPILKTMNCPLCDYSGRQTSELSDHFIQVHNIEIRSSSHNFVSLEDFTAWKGKIENDSKSHFVKRRGTVVVNTRQTIHYACHRSGNFNSRSKGLRKLKNQGSNKIDGFCPANMKVTVSENGACGVKFLSTHVGHENDLGHLSLKPSEREEIAGKIAQKISFSNILNEVRDSFQSSQSERIHLLTRKDLHNIKRSFNLHSVSHESETMLSTYLEQKEAHVDEYQSDEEEELIITTDCDSADEKSSEVLDKLDLKDDSVMEEIYIYQHGAASLAEEKEKLKEILMKLINDIGSIEQVEHVKKVISEIYSSLNTAKRKEKIAIVEVIPDQKNVQ